MRPLQSVLLYYSTNISVCQEKCKFMAQSKLAVDNSFFDGLPFEKAKKEEIYL